MNWGKVHDVATGDLSLRCNPQDEDLKWVEMKHTVPFSLTTKLFGVCDGDDTLDRHAFGRKGVSDKKRERTGDMEEEQRGKDDQRQLCGWW